MLQWSIAANEGLGQSPSIISGGQADEAFGELRFQAEASARVKSLSELIWLGGRAMAYPFAQSPPKTATERLFQRQ